jgi:REP element-mobilizing transposase RayT
MPNTIGYHLVKSAYGLWLPGDDRGSWSESWDDQIGFIEHHNLNPADPVRLRMAQERMQHPPVAFTAAMIDAIANSIADCVARSNGGLTISAFAIEPTHMHIAIPYSGRDIDRTAKWLADRTTKSIHQQTNHTGPVWCKGKWCSFVFDDAYWQRIIDYIQTHNTRHGYHANPYPFISATPPPQSL